MPKCALKIALSNKDKDIKGWKRPTPNKANQSEQRLINIH